MAKVEEVVADMRRNAKGTRYRDLCKVCGFYFGKACRTGTSHHVYKTPWPDDPRVNIQNAGGMARAYQVRQVLKAIDRLETWGDAQE
jgi:hypothetical protein